MSQKKIAKQRQFELRQKVLEKQYTHKLTIKKTRLVKVKFLDLTIQRKIHNKNPLLVEN